MAQVSERVTGTQVVPSPYLVLLAEQAVSILSPLLFIGLWEAAVRTQLLDWRFFPAPSAILGELTTLLGSGELAPHVVVSVKRVFLGFLVGAFPGLVLGLAMGLSRWVRAAVNPLVAATYPIPKSAIVPLVMLIFGLGDASKVALVAIGVFYLVLINTTAGVLHIERIYLEAAKNFGANRLRLFLTVALPGALPLIFTGLRLGTGIGLILIVIAEMVGARSGIGYLIWQAWTIFDVERMYVGLVVIAILGWLTTLVFDYTERLLIPWKPRL